MYTLNERIKNTVMDTNGGKKMHRSGHFSRQEILYFIAEYHQVHGISPTYREIQDGVMFAGVSTVAYHLDVLKEAGLIEAGKHVSRTVRLTPDALTMIGPILIAEE